MSFSELSGLRSCSPDGGRWWSAVFVGQAEVPDEASFFHFPPSRKPEAFEGYRNCPWLALIAQPVKNLLQCRRPWFDSWVGKIHWRRDRLPTPVFLGFLGGSVGKESIYHAGDLSLIPGLGRSPGEGKGYPLQYSENSMDYVVHGVAKSHKQLSDFHSLSCFHRFTLSTTILNTTAMRKPRKSRMVWLCWRPWLR